VAAATVSGPVVPDEAIQVALRALVVAQNRYPEWEADELWREALTAAAPLILDANRAEVGDDLRTVIDAALVERFYTSKADLLAALAPAVASFVAAQVAAARAEENHHAHELVELARQSVADGLSVPDPLRTLSGWLSQRAEELTPGD
jgi:hypothetical protein